MSLTPIMSLPSNYKVEFEQVYYVYCVGHRKTFCRREKHLTWKLNKK